MFDARRGIMYLWKTFLNGFLVKGFYLYRGSSSYSRIGEIVGHEF